MASTQTLIGNRAKTPAAGGGLDIHEDGLVCYVDAGITDSYGGSGLTWTDLSTESNDHTWDTTAPSHTSGSAGYFDLTQAATDDTSGGTTNLSAGAGTWTVECWFNTDDAAAYQAMWWLGLNNAGPEGLFLGLDGAGALYVETSDSTQLFGGNLSASTWYSAVVTYDGTNLELFTNNVSDGTLTEAMNLTFGTASIGWDGGRYGDRFNGKIAALIVYNDVLSASERGTNYTEFTSRY